MTPTGPNDISNQELLEAISKGFSSLEKRFDEKIGENTEAIEKVERKIDGLQNSFETEMVRRTDEHANHEKRIINIEEKVFEESV